MNFNLYTKQRIANTALLFEGIHLPEQQLNYLLLAKPDIVHLDEVDTTIVKNLINTLDFINILYLQNTNINITLYKKLNLILASEQALFPGKLRTADCFIGCIDKPIPPCEQDFIEKQLDTLNNLKEDNYKATIANAFATLIRSQPFYDGNKRSTLFLCNIALVKNGFNCFFIPTEKYQEFENKLLDFYKNNKKEEFTSFIVEKLFDET